MLLRKIQMDGRKWLSIAEAVEQTAITFCVVCSNQSNQESNKSFFFFYRVPRIVAHKREKYKKLTEKTADKTALYS